MAKKTQIPADVRSASEVFNERRFFPGRGAPQFAYKRHAYLTPNKWRRSEPFWAARLFVGFSVDDESKYSMEDLLPIVKRVRREQIGMADSSFVYQKGVYTHEDGSEVTEDAAQVLILNLDEDTSPEQFTEDMIELAEIVQTELEQESVIVEIQEGGVVQEVIGIDDKPWESE